MMNALKIVIVDDDPTYLESLEYLLKKYFPEMQLTREQIPVSAKINGNNIAFPCLEGLIFIDTTQIIYCASDGNYTRIYLVDSRSLVVCRSLKEMEHVVSGRMFYRTHKQYLVSLNFISRYNNGDGGEVEMSNGIRLPVARNRKAAFLQIFGR